MYNEEKNKALTFDLRQVKMFHDRFIEKKSGDTLQGKYDVLRGKFFLSSTRNFEVRKFFCFQLKNENAIF